MTTRFSVGIVGLAVLVFSLGGFSNGSLIPADRVTSPISVSSLSLDDMEYTRAALLLEDRYAPLLKKPIAMTIEGQPYTLSPAELGFSFDPFQTLEEVDRAGRDRSLAQQLQTNFLAGESETNIDPVIHFDADRFRAALNELPLDDRSTVTVSLYGLTSTLHLEEETLEEEIDPNAVHWSSISIPEPFVFHPTDGTEDVTLRFSRDWLDFNVADADGVYRTVDESKVLDYLETKLAPKIDVPSQDAVLMALPAEGSDFATVEGIAHDGQALNLEATLEGYLSAVAQDEREATLVVETVAGKILNETGTDIGDLELLGTGHSNFITSPAGRDFNVRKGLNEKVNSILVAPGAEYDFNKNLGPVTNSAGWQNSLAIFGGSDLRSVPGGGLCQVSTTAYRAGLDAGFPIVEQYNHSLYVHYYTEGGDGLDSTIFPGVKNLRFLNDSGNYLLIQAYDDGYDAYVKIYGTSDGREAELIGPYYPGEVPEEHQDLLPLKSNQIGWVRVIRDASGAVKSEEPRISTYRSIPY